MRKFQILIALMAVVVALVLPTGVAGASGGLSPANYTDLTVGDVLNETGAAGFVFRGETFADTEGHVRFIMDAPVRQKTFEDGLGRSAIRIRSDEEGIALILPKAPAKGGSLQKWATHSLPSRAVVTVKAVDIIVDGKSVGDVLPAQWRIDPIGTISNLRPATGDEPKGSLGGKTCWYSAGDLVADAGDVLLGKDLPVYGEEFADRWGIATKVTWGKKVRAETTRVTALVDRWVRQPEDGSFDRANFVKIEEFVDQAVGKKGLATTPTWPARLSGIRLWDDSGKFLLAEGESLWVSSRHLYAYDLESETSGETWFSTTADALGSREPFVDVYGGAYCLTGITSAGKRTLNLTSTPTPLWIFARLHRSLWLKDVVSYNLYNK